MSDFIFLLSNKPYPVPVIEKKKPKKSDDPLPKSESFSKCRTIASAYQRNRKIVNRNRVLELVINTKKAGIFSEDAARIVGLNVDYTRRLLKELELAGFIYKSIESRGNSPAKWKAINELPKLRK